MEKAELLEANPEYAFVRLESGRETTVSLREVAPYVPPTEPQNDTPATMADSNMITSEITPHFVQDNEAHNKEFVPEVLENASQPQPIPEEPVVRRSSRHSTPPQRFADSKYSCSSVLLS